MFSFSSIKELINTLNREKELLSELFEKRRIPFREEYAFELVDSREERLAFLKERGVLRANGQYIEIDDQFLQFFELVLEVNEEINTSYIHESIRQIRENILYYLQENSEARRYSYLRAVKTGLRKIGRITLRNIVDLNRNIENTFKTEPTYRIKIAKLESHDGKRQDISALLDQTERLLTEDEQTFFRTALDEELRQVTLELRFLMIESRHNLIEIQKQIIEYLNRIKYQNRVAEKLRQIKYLKDQFELRTKTDIDEVLAGGHNVIFEPNPSYPLKISLEFLQTDEAWQSILRTALRLKVPSGAAGLPLAGEIGDAYLRAETEREIIIDLDELKNGFSASGNHLFSFIMNYAFDREVSFRERITLYCQMVSLYEKELNVTENFGRHEGIEYAMVYPGKG